jgi:hypothetical protein
VGGLNAGATVEVLDAVQGSDLLIARREGEGQAVLEQGQAETDALRHDVLGSPLQGEARSTRSVLP